MLVQRRWKNESTKAEGQEGGFKRIYKFYRLYTWGNAKQPLVPMTIPLASKQQVTNETSCLYLYECVRGGMYLLRSGSSRTGMKLGDVLLRLTLGKPSRLCE